MPDSTAEAALKALRGVILAAAPPDVRVERNALLAENIPQAGLIVVRDGDPGRLETTMSPLIYHHEHRAAVEVLVSGMDSADRDAKFDALQQLVSGAILADRTLGGAVDWAEVEPASAQAVLPVGGDPIKAVSLTVILFFDTNDPLN